MVLPDYLTHPPQLCPIHFHEHKWLVPLPSFPATSENTVIEITINAIVNMGLLFLPTD